MGSELTPAHRGGDDPIWVSACPTAWLQVRKFIGEYGGALVEEFIAGREFTVLVAENPHDGTEQPLTVYTPVECIFSQGEVR